MQWSLRGWYGQTTSHSDVKTIHWFLVESGWIHIFTSQNKTNILFCIQMWKAIKDKHRVTTHNQPQSRKEPHQLGFIHITKLQKQKISTICR